MFGARKTMHKALLGAVLAATLVVPGACAHPSNRFTLCGQTLYTGRNSLGPVELGPSSSDASSTAPTSSTLPPMLAADSNGQPQFDKIRQVVRIAKNCRTAPVVVAVAPGAHTVTVVHAKDGGIVAFSLDKADGPLAVSAYVGDELVGSVRESEPRETSAP